MHLFSAPMVSKVARRSGLTHRVNPALILAVSDPSHHNGSETHADTHARAGADTLQSFVATVTAASMSNGSLCSHDVFRGAASKSRPKAPAPC